MLNTSVVFIKTDGKRSEILLSPICLQSPDISSLKSDIISGRISKFYLYEGWRDKSYLENLKKKTSAEHYKAEKYLINYGQDFRKFYLGCLTTATDDKSLWQWDGDASKISDASVECLKAVLFTEDIESRDIVIFTPTR